MKTSHVMKMLRDLEDSIEFAGRGEFRALKFMQRLDELGYDVTERTPDLIVPVSTAQHAVAAAIHESSEANGLFRD